MNWRQTGAEPSSTLPPISLLTRAKKASVVKPRLAGQVVSTFVSPVFADRRHEYDDVSVHSAFASALLQEEDRAVYDSQQPSPQRHDSMDELYALMRGTSGQAPGQRSPQHDDPPPTPPPRPSLPSSPQSTLVQLMQQKKQQDKQHIDHQQLQQLPQQHPQHQQHQQHQPSAQFSRQSSQESHLAEFVSSSNKASAPARHSSSATAAERQYYASALASAAADALRATAAAHQQPDYSTWPSYERAVADDCPSDVASINSDSGNSYDLAINDLEVEPDADNIQHKPRPESLRQREQEFSDSGHGASGEDVTEQGSQDCGASGDMHGSPVDAAMEDQLQCSLNSKPQDGGGARPRRESSIQHNVLANAEACNGGDPQDIRSTSSADEAALRLSSAATAPCSNTRLQMIGGHTQPVLGDDSNIVQGGQDNPGSEIYEGDGSATLEGDRITLSIANTESGLGSSQQAPEDRWVEVPTSVGSASPAPSLVDVELAAVAEAAAPLGMPSAPPLSPPGYVYKVDDVCYMSAGAGRSGWPQTPLYASMRRKSRPASAESAAEIITQPLEVASKTGTVTEMPADVESQSVISESSLYDNPLGRAFKPIKDGP